MNNSKDTFRYEIKCKQNLNIDHVFLLLKLNNNLIYNTYPDRIINSLYLDNEFFDSYYDNINGNNERKKYRIRWYGEQNTDLINPNFEIKHKKGHVGTKYISKLKNIPFSKLNNNNSIIRYILDSKINQKYSYRIKKYRPISIISYTRSYYQTRSLPIRITVDRNVNYFSLYNKNLLNLDYPIKQRDKIIIEYKFPIEFYQQASNIINAIGLRRTKSSKYIDSIAALRLLNI